MNFYGVGTILGGKTDNPREKLEEYLDYDFWCMGYSDEEKPKYAELIKQINEGDIIIAKAHSSGGIYYVKAIGIVTKIKKPDIVPEVFCDKSGISVLWFKRFKPYISLSGEIFKVGGTRMNTIYQETDDDNISVIKEMMKYNFMMEE